MRCSVGRKSPKARDHARLYTAAHLGRSALRLPRRLFRPLTASSTCQVVSGAPPKPCDDRHPSCEQWADGGECDANPGYMHTECAGSCNTCEKVEL